MDLFEICLWIKRNLIQRVCSKCDVRSNRKPVEGPQSCGDGEHEDKNKNLRVQHRIFHMVSFPSPVTQYHLHRDPKSGKCRFNSRVPYLSRNTSAVCNRLSSGWNDVSDPKGNLFKCRYLYLLTLPNLTSQSVSVSLSIKISVWLKLFFMASYNILWKKDSHFYNRLKVFLEFFSYTGVECWFDAAC